MMSRSTSSVQSAVYNALRNSILTLQLKPGTVMSTQEIAQKLDVSRTPVREAFIRLQMDGLVNIHPQKETMVSRIDFTKVEQERFVRESLECANIDLFAELCTDKDIDELELNIEQQQGTLRACDYIALLKLDNAFHKYMFKVTGQQLSWETIENTSNHYARIRMLTVWGKDIMSDIIAQHKKILGLLKEENAGQAKLLMKAHLHRLEEQLQPLIIKYPNYFEKESIPATERFEAILASQ